MFDVCTIYLHGNNTSDLPLKHVYELAKVILALFQFLICFDRNFGACLYDVSPEFQQNLNDKRKKIGISEKLCNTTPGKHFKPDLFLDLFSCAM